MLPADRIRNVALVGHRGAGKTSLHEALLFESGTINRLGSVPDGGTVSDAGADEQARQMSISATLSSLRWQERKVNLLDTPGEPSFVADALGALQVCEAAVFVVNAVMGVEVSTARLWQRAAELDIARMLFVNMLDRERADFYRTLDQLKQAFGQHVVATEIPIGAEHELAGVIDLIDMTAFRQDSPERGAWTQIEIPAEHAQRAQEYREKLMDEVSEVSDALMERYLEGEEIAHEEIVGALKEGTNHGRIFPVVCGVATRNLGTSRLLDAIVEDLPSPVKHGGLPAVREHAGHGRDATKRDGGAGGAGGDGYGVARDRDGATASGGEVDAPAGEVNPPAGEVDPPAGEDGAPAGEDGDSLELRPDPAGELYAYVFKTRADPFAGRINLLRVYQGTLRADSHVLNVRARAKERIGQLIVFAGADTGHLQELGPGDIGAVAKLKETRAGDWLTEREGHGADVQMPALVLPAPVMAFAVEPGSRGEEEKVFTALRRLQEEDPTIDLHRDPQTGEQIVAGLSQVHVEVIVDRLRDRFGVEVTLKPPRVPYQETIRSAAKAHGRHKKQSGGRGQFGDCHIEIEPLRPGMGFEFVDQIKGGVIPSSFIPAVEKGVREAMDTGVLAGYPVKDVRVRLYDGSYHSVDSSEIAFKLAGAQAMREALRAADPVLLEPIMLVTLSVPESCVGDVIGDLNSRRGRPQGMEPAGGMTEIKAEAPMAEMLSYAPDLRSITGGQGDYTLEFLRYEEVPGHLAQKIVQGAAAEHAALHA